MWFRILAIILSESDCFMGYGLLGVSSYDFTVPDADDDDVSNCVEYDVKNQI